jgi:hypothetical protein
LAAAISTGSVTARAGQLAASPSDSRWSPTASSSADFCDGLQDDYYALKTMYENAARYSEIREHSHDTTVLEEKIRDAFCQVIFFSSEHCDGFADDESDLQYVIVCNMIS